MDNTTYEKAYSESSFWEKLAKYAKVAGKELVTNALKLYYAIALGKANVAQVATIVAALGYFISPADVIPDLVPGGYADDAGVIAATVALLTCCADKEVVAAAKKKANEWFDQPSDNVTK